MKATLKQVAQFCIVFDCYAKVSKDKRFVNMFDNITNQYVNRLYLK